MPPHLHPRSTATSTLFAGTLLASFIVVGIPHVFPCPRPARGKGYADSERQLDADGNPIVRRKRNGTARATDSIKPSQDQTALAVSEQTKKAQRMRSLEEEAALFRELQVEAELLEKEARECPVPKPRGMIGRLLGFEDAKKKTKMDGVVEGES